MRVALIASDKPGALQIRLDNRDAYLVHTKKTGVVEMAGPFLDADGTKCGSMIIINVDGLSAAQTWTKNDPYAKAGLFEKFGSKNGKR